MKKKFGTLILICAIIFITCVGFSTWVIVQDYSETPIDINVGVVNDKKKLFSFDEILPFKFNKYGVLKDEIYQEKGEIAIQFKIKSKDGIDVFYPSNTFLLNFTFSSLNSVNLINYISKDDLTCDYFISYDNYLDFNSMSPTGKSVITVDGSSATSSIDFNGEDKEIATHDYIYFTLLYKFDFSDVFLNFESEIYNHLIADNSVVFDFIIGIE